jgi:hypothetical protein
MESLEDEWAEIVIAIKRDIEYSDQQGGTPD